MILDQLEDDDNVVRSDMQLQNYETLEHNLGTTKKEISMRSIKRVSRPWRREWMNKLRKEQVKGGESNVGNLLKEFMQTN